MPRGSRGARQETCGTAISSPPDGSLLLGQSGYTLERAGCRELACGDAGEGAGPLTEEALLLPESGIHSDIQSCPSCALHPPTSSFSFPLPASCPCYSCPSYSVSLSPSPLHLCIGNFY